jgi:DNA repair protein RadA/Sms
MPKLKTVYRCQDCGYSSPKWLGQCSGCSAWSTLVEEVVERETAPRGLTDFTSEATRVGDVKLVNEPRTATNIAELDRILGGGLVGGQVALLAGPPGIGKSTLSLQAAAKLAVGGRAILYVSGEESLRQVSARAKRLGVSSESLYLLSETNLTKILAAFEKLKPWGVVLDSVQTVYDPELASAPGSVGQVRECAARIVQAAKRDDRVILLLGHVTKEGSLAGPKVLEHIVDTVLYFDTERHDLLRVLRAHKNRFGPTDETGLFEMAETGLRQVSDAASYFIADRDGRAQAGRAVSVTLEGSRPMLVEAQALVVHTKYPLPRRMATGLDLNRVLVLLAAMEKHLRLRLEERDVFVSLAGGVRLKDPALDLAACMAVCSSARDLSLPADTVLVGEVGLLGEVGRVPALESRLKEAAKAGFKKAVVCGRAVRDLPRGLGLEVAGAADLKEAAALLLRGAGDDTEENL